MMDAIACKISNEVDLNDAVSLAGCYLSELECLHKQDV